MRSTWEKLLSIIIIALTMYFVLSLVSAMIPYEEAPRVEIATNGTTVCVIQSLREAVLWPVGIVLFFSLAIGASVIIVCRKGVVSDTELSGTRRWLGWMLLGVVVLPFVAVTFGMVVLSPYREFRKATVGPEGIVLSSLYRSWSIRLSDVQEVEILRRERTAAHERLLDLQVLLKTKDNREYWSAEVESLAPNSPDFRRCEAVLRKTIEALKGR